VNLAERLGRRIRQFRTELGLTPAQVAWESDPGLSRAHLANIESGTKLPSLRTLMGIANRLGVDPFELLVFADQSPLAEVVDLLRHLPQDRLMALRRTLRTEVEAARSRR